MGNITLLRRDAHLDHLKPGIKLDTWCALRNSPLNSCGLFPDDMVRRAEDEIAKAETERRTTQPGSGHGGYGSRKQNRFQPYQGGWNHTPKTRTSQLGAPLEGTAATGVGEEVPLQEVVTPRPSKGITKNDNYCASSVQTQDL